MRNGIKNGKSQIKSKTLMRWSSQKKNEGIFCTAYYVLKGPFLRFVIYLNVFSVLNRLSDYTNF